MIRNFRFRPLSRASYASPDLCTTNLPPEQANGHHVKRQNLLTNVQTRLPLEWGPVPDQASPTCSLTTSRALLSSRNPANFECRSRSASVHSKNSICATASGRSQTHSFIFSAVNSSPHRDLCVSGRLTKGIAGDARERIFSIQVGRLTGASPDRTRQRSVDHLP